MIPNNKSIDVVCFTFGKKSFSPSVRMVEEREEKKSIKNELNLCIWTGKVLGALGVKCTRSYLSVYSYGLCVDFHVC